MGLNTMGSGSNNITYFGLYQGELVIEYDEKEKLEKKIERLGLDIDDIESRKRTKGKNEGKKVYYYVFNDVEGQLTNVYLDETDWGEMLKLELTDVNEKYVISLGEVFSRYAKDFIRRMDSINFQEDIAVGTWTMEGDNGKTYSGVRLYQNGEKVEYTLELEDLPAPIERKKGKKKEWDYSEQEEFLYDKIEGWIEENFKGREQTEEEEDKSTKKNKKDKKLTGKKKSEKKDKPEKEEEQQETKKSKKNKKGSKSKDKKSKDKGKGDKDDLPWD